MLRGVDVDALSGLGVGLGHIRAALGGTVHDDVDLVVGEEVVDSLGVGQVKLDVGRAGEAEASDWSSAMAEGQIVKRIRHDNKRTLVALVGEVGRDGAAQQTACT